MEDLCKFVLVQVDVKTCSVMSVVDLRITKGIKKL
ncbi:hypothetical protein T12_1519, partial [Trichinella patagoniensis]